MKCYAQNCMDTFSFKPKKKKGVYEITTYICRLKLYEKKAHTRKKNEFVENKNTNLVIGYFCSALYNNKVFLVWFFHSKKLLLFFVLFYS